MPRIEYPAVVGFFRDGHTLLHATEETRHHFHKKNMDAYTPYPVHGMEDALGLRRSHVSTITRYVLVIGWGLGFLFQAWTSAVDWPINIGGKPYVSTPAFAPVTFETGVLLAGITNLLIMLAFCRLYPRPKTLVIDPDLTDNKFALVVPAKDAAEEQKIVDYLDSMGAIECVILAGEDSDRQEYIYRAALVTGKGAPAHA